MAGLGTFRSRRFFYYLVIFSVLGIFLVGYFYYYLPTNRQRMHKNGFLILKTITENLNEKADSKLNLYKNIYRNSQDLPTVRKILLESSSDTSGFRDVSTRKSGAKAAGTGIFSGSPDGKTEINGDTIEYKVGAKSKSGRIYIFTESIADFVEPILVTQKSEIFKGFAILRAVKKDKKDTSSMRHLVYQDDGLGIRSDVQLDSLLPQKGQNFLPGIREVTAGESKEKIFIYPFEMVGKSYFLCGFADPEKYHLTLTKVPFYFVYPLAIFFLLLLVFIPVLKFYIMDSGEQLTVGDIFFLGLSVFVGFSVFTLVVIQFLLWKGDEIRGRNNLIKLSERIGSEFNYELELMYGRMLALDNCRREDAPLLSRPGINTVNYSQRVRSYSGNPKEDPYYSYDRISWLDSAGNQIIKAEMHGTPVFANIRSRTYFRAIRQDSAFRLPRKTGGTMEFGLEPLYSWTNGDFNVTISARSVYRPEKEVVALASKMYSVVQTVLPVGYGFCLIDKTGRVLLHSDGNRNLRENLFEKAGPPDALRAAVISRQEATVNDVELYGKWRMMHIRPVLNLPYYLVTFYDKGFNIAVNMRILVFALLFCAFSGFIWLLLWLALGWINLRNNPLLFSPMDGMAWITPKPKETAFYEQGAAVLGLYVLLFLSFSWLYRFDRVSNFSIFLLTLLTPVNVIFLLFTIRSMLAFQSIPENTARAGRIRLNVRMLIGFYVGLTAVVGLSADSAGYQVDAFFPLFQGLILGGMLYFLWSGTGGRLNTAWYPHRYHEGYCLLLTLSIVCLSVIPSIFFTWYAHNQELIQTVKKVQLKMAEDLRQRSNLMVRKLQPDGQPVPSYSNLHKRITLQGVYHFFDDTICLKNEPNYRGDEEIRNEKFYSEFAEAVSNQFYDPLIYPALESGAADSSWRWRVDRGKIEFWYNFPLHLPAAPPNDAGFLHMVSCIPERFVFFKDIRIVVLLLIVSILAAALFYWLRALSANLFLISFSKVSKTQTAPDSGPLSTFTSLSSFDCPPAAACLYPWGADPVSPAEVDAALLTAYEETMLERVEKIRPMADQIWQQCSEKERFLLFDLAVDGLINYKNWIEIYHLLARGILTINQLKVTFFSPVFRAYLITKDGDAEVKQLHRKFHQNSTWQSMKGPLSLLLTGVAVLVFFTQEEMYQKLLALTTGLPGLITFLTRFVSLGNGQAGEGK
ncbi:PDC sensor domain-containing protein [Larkinella soli]|uniref:PDC sensor domain-containing protein n=1 Tax=Larkinella soli TaxID=1770527 RepID=UPI000FFC2143|nr:cache domain-containing protein [Larkinella soli]